MHDHLPCDATSGLLQAGSDRPLQSSAGSLTECVAPSRRSCPVRQGG